MPPKRKKNQVLEDKSRRVFEEVLPEEWVVRTIPKDYGIDTEVEIFDSAEATGLTFKVQLKSTASVKTKIPSQSVTISHLKYWLSLDVPVMIALYVEADNAYYYRWASSHDPGIDGWRKKSTTIRYEGQQDEIPGRGSEIFGEVVLLRQLRMRQLPSVIPLRLTSKIPMIPNARFVQRLRTRLRQCGLNNLIEVVVDSQSPALQIEATKHHLKVSYPLNTGSFTAHSQGSVQLAETEDSLTANCLVVLAALLASHGNSATAIAILDHDKFGGSVWNYESVAKELAAGMGQSKRLDLALAYARACFEIHGIDCFDLIETYLIPVIALAHEVELSLRPEVLSLFHALVDAALVTGQNELAGRLYFNMGRISRVFDEPVAGMAHYALALKNRPTYESSYDFWEVYAAAQFRVGNYSGSASSYEKAWSLRKSNADLSLLPEFADALLYAGEYERCEQLLQADYVGKFSRLVQVDRAAVRQVRATTGLASQQRIPELGDLDAPTNEREAVERLRNTDALDPGLWKALLEMTAQPSADLAVAVARFYTKSAEAWALATVLVYQDDPESELMRGVLETALVDAPDEFDDAVTKVASQRLPASEQGNLLTLIEEVAGTTTEERHSSLRQLQPS